MTWVKRSYANYLKLLLEAINKPGILSLCYFHPTNGRELVNPEKRKHSKINCLKICNKYRIKLVKYESADKKIMGYANTKEKNRLL